MKLWDRYSIMRDFYGGIAVSFESLWYDFLARQFVSEQPSVWTFDQISRELEAHVIRKTDHHLRRLKPIKQMK
jgi:hypothetical protein